MHAPPDRSRSPYRDVHPTNVAPDSRRAVGALDERALLWFLVLLGAARVAITAHAERTWDGATTVLVLLALYAARRLLAIEREADTPR